MIYGLKQIENKIYNYCLSFIDNDENEININTQLGVTPTILFYGRSATGKSSLAKELYNRLKSDYNIDIYLLDFEDILSPNLGESSKNLMSFLKSISDDLTVNKSKAFIIFEEIDSILNSRYSKNDNDGVKRVLLTLNKVIDRLVEPPFAGNVILVGTTNMIENIDTAIYRRFFVKFSLDIKLNRGDFYEYIKSLLRICKFEASFYEKEIDEWFNYYIEHNLTLGEIKQIFARNRIEIKFENKSTIKFKIEEMSIDEQMKYQKGKYLI